MTDNFESPYWTGRSINCTSTCENSRLLLSSCTSYLRKKRDSYKSTVFLVNAVILYSRVARDMHPLLLIETRLIDVPYCILAPVHASDYRCGSESTSVIRQCPRRGPNTDVYRITHYTCPIAENSG